jgi:hypothetical protein
MVAIGPAARFSTRAGGRVRWLGWLGSVGVVGVLALPGVAHAYTHWQTETAEPVYLSGSGCGSVASYLMQLPPRGPIGTVFELRVLNLRVGQKLTDSSTGQVTATVTSVRLLHVSRFGADLRFRVVASDASCTDPKLLQSGWTADPRIRVRFLEVVPNTECAQPRHHGIYGVVVYIVSCRFGRQLALAWTSSCHDDSCRLRGYRCTRRRDKLVDCIRRRREVTWVLTPI